MPTKQQEQQPADRQNQQSDKRAADISNYLIDALREPGDLHSVQVRPLWEDHYRVNVFVGVDTASAKIAHSYFLVADATGNILASTPKVTRQYGPGAKGNAGAGAASPIPLADS